MSLCVYVPPLGVNTTTLLGHGAVCWLQLVAPEKHDPCATYTLPTASTAMPDGVVNGVAGSLIWLLT